jgi:hypothetical protein
MPPPRPCIGAGAMTPRIDQYTLAMSIRPAD